MGTITPDRSAKLLRIVLLIDAAVFLGAALLNAGVEIPLGFGTLRFADPIWQAGTGEAIIGATLLAAGLTGRVRLSWVAWSMSVLGILFGLSSARVQGLARDIHVVLIPLAVLLLVALLLARTGGGPRPSHAVPGKERR
ncbi:MAG TPA: hypothetical protein VH912_29560 [Streptosporangiaceae bacterium]|jgi:hypothetical protein